MPSVWETGKTKSFKPLGEDVEADVCVVGGGLAGVWCAYLLSREGKEVVLLESERLGQSATLYTTGFVTEVIDTDLGDLLRMFGERRAALSLRTGAEAIRLIESVVAEEGIDCEFMRLPFFSYAGSRGELGPLYREARAAERLGLKAGVIRSGLNGFRNFGSLAVPEQAKYHPMKFFDGLVLAAERKGVRFHEKTEAVEVSPSSKLKVGGMSVLTKSGRSVRARDVVVATYEPFNNPEVTRWKKGMYTSYVYALELPPGALPEMMCEDRMNPYHYFRVDDLGDRQRMVVGGEDHRRELGFMKDKSFRALRQFIDETFPELDYAITHKWAGGILEPSDGLPLIGRYADHEYVATAFSGNGMTYSAIAGRILSDLIMERASEYEEIYDPRRAMRVKPILYKFRDYAGEFFGGAVKNLLK